MTKHVDLNCDMGEGFGAWRMGQDEALLDLVTSANIACGYHAGDPATMARTVKAAVARIDGVTDLKEHPLSEAPGVAGFILKTPRKGDGISAVAARMVQNGWSIRELRRRERTLEDIFIEVIGRDTAIGA